MTIIAVMLPLVLLFGCAGSPPPSGQAGNKVTLEFLYADWCSHCNAMKPYVSELQGKLPKERFEVVMLNEKDVATNPSVAAIYQKYQANGFFTGFPTFIINGENPLVGERPQANFNFWVCSYFEAPRPDACRA